MELFVRQFYAGGIISACYLAITYYIDFPTERLLQLLVSGMNISVEFELRMKYTWIAYVMLLMHRDSGVQKRLPNNLNFVLKICKLFEEVTGGSEIINYNSHTMLRIHLTL